MSDFLPQAFDLSIGLVSLSVTIILGLVGLVFKLISDRIERVGKEVQGLKVEFCKVRDKLPDQFVRTEVFKMLIDQANEWRKEVRDWRGEVRSEFSKVDATLRSILGPRK